MVIRAKKHSLNSIVPSVIATIFVVCIAYTNLYGKVLNYEFSHLAGREYVQTNTWNGCCQFSVGQKTRFLSWECPETECLFAINIAIHHVRYERNVVTPFKYYEQVVEGNPSNTEKIVRINLNQFPPRPYEDLVINGKRLKDMNLRVLPFQVVNPNSKSSLHCILVGFFTGEQFCFAVYVNFNTGKASLDFHEVAIEGYALVASESRYPFLISDECKAQQDVYVKYFKKSDRSIKKPSKKKDVRMTPDVKDIEVLVEDL